MGWWGEGIMEGDPPYDAEADIIDLCGANAPLSAGLLEANQNKIADFVTQNPGLGNEAGIPAQVWGVLIMRCGAPMPDKVRKLVVQGIEASLNPAAVSCWTDPEARLRALGAFREQVNTYPSHGGEEVHVPHTGLFQKLYEGIPT